MRRPVWPLAPSRNIEAAAADGLDGRGSKRFLFGHGRQDSGQTQGEHCLTRARRADHEDAVTSGGRNLQSALGTRLAPYLRHIRISDLGGMQRAGISQKRLVARNVATHVEKALCRI